MYGMVKLSVDENTGRITRQLQRRDGIPTLAQMQEAVGGYITTGFRIQSATRPNVSIDYYVDDEGLLMSGNPVAKYLLEDGRVYELAGSGIFVGGDDDTGDAVALTAEEFGQIGGVQLFPIGITE